MEDKDLFLLDFPISSSTPEHEATIIILATALEIPTVFPMNPSLQLLFLQL